MRERNKNVDIGQARLLDINQLCHYIGIGKNNARKIAAEANAVRRFGKTVRYDRKMIDCYLDAFAKISS